MTSMPSVLAFMAHPDDIEFTCGGTLLLLHDLGCPIHMATMTPGDAGSATLSGEEISRIRVAEAQASARLLDASYECANLRDFMVCYTPDAIRRAGEIVRRAAPDIVFTHPPDDYMIDHEQTSRLVRTACFCAGVPNMKTDGLPAAPPIHGIPALFYVAPVEGKDIFGNRAPMSIWTDVTDVRERIEQLLSCHASQREWIRAHHGVDEYIDMMRRSTAEAGRDAGCAAAEGFRQHLGHPYPQTNPLRDLLGERLIVQRTGGGATSPGAPSGAGNG